MPAHAAPKEPVDPAILALLQTLYTPVVCDVLDSLGRRRQSLSSGVRALTGANRLCGRIFPARAATVERPPAQPYSLEIAAVDAMSPGEVLVVDGGGAVHCGFWGELLTTACMAKGVRGVVMTACSRDAWKLRELDFPVFGLGWHPADSLGRADVVELGEPVVIDEVLVRWGDWVLGDEDGVVVIPEDCVGETLRLATAKAAAENRVRDELLRGVPMGEVFRRYGIL